MSYASEKPGELLPSSTVPSQARRAKGAALVLFVCAALIFGRHCNESMVALFENSVSLEDQCPQPPILEPSNSLLSVMAREINTTEFAARAVDWLGGAVRIPTESFDNLGPVGEDARWDAFQPFHEYLLKAYPKVHSALKLTKLNTYALLYEWKGSDATLKPIMLAGHQDVVPVDMTTADMWTHPPYSGHFDGKYIWGRGSSDDKGGLIAIMSSIEQLLEHDFKPTRTVVLAFGFDEEISGRQGAAKLAPAILSIYGKDGIASIVDEGNGFAESYNGVFATPAVAEKGYLDTKVEVTAAGGHSSLPPPHTSIGILASLLVKFEANPIKTSLERGTTIYKTLQCFAEYAPDLDETLRKAIKRSAKSDRALNEVQEIIYKERAMESLVGTTSAIDMIQGGVKVNALPERAYAIINHRIATQSSVEAVKARDTNLLKPLAAHHNLTYVAFGENISESGAPFTGTLTLMDPYDHAINPAPVTPTTGETPAFKLLSGTIKATYNAQRGGHPEKAIFIAPSISSGNTDTKYYWDLSKHIYRYNHHNSIGEVGLGGVHTVDERMALEAFVEMVRFFHTYILNADEARDL